MRDIYKTAKQAQMAPVRGRVKAMIAQPRAVAQARKTARQTTGFAKGGVPSMIYGTSRPGVFKAPRGREGMKRRLALEEKLGMQKTGLINKKTGRLHPEHEATIKTLSKAELRQMIRTGRNPKLGKGPGSKETKLEGKYFKEMKAKGIKKRGGVIKKKKPKWAPQIPTGTGPTFPGPPEEIKKILKKQEGGSVKPMSHDSESVKWFKEKWGGTKKKKPHSTREGRIAAGERALRRNAEYWNKKREEEKKKRRAGPQAPAQPRPKAGPPAGMPDPKGERKMIRDKEEPGMYVKKGGVVQKAFVGKLMEMFGRGKKATAYGDPAKQGGPAPTRKQTMDVFKDKFAGRHKKGGVMEKGKPHSTTEGKVSSIQRKYKRALANVLKNKDRLTTRDIERAEKLTKGVGIGIADSAVNSIDKMLKMIQKDKSIVGKKKGGKVDKKWIQKAVNPKHKGYCTPMTKPTCTPARKRLAKLFKSKAKKGWAKGGLPYLTRGWSSGKAGVYKTPRGKHHMDELLKAHPSSFLARRAVLSGGKGSLSKKKLAAVAGIGAIGAETYRQKTKEKKKKYKSKARPHKESVEDSIRRKIKKKANGGTIVMPTVGNEIGTRAYKHGAVIHPRPKPTTVAHGRMRGVGIAKRGW